MDINSAFPSDWLKATDLQGRPVRLIITEVVTEKVGDDYRPIVHFQKTKKGLVLNKTNSNSIAEVYGTETDNWTGCIIELYPDKTDYQGKRVDCIRIRVPRETGQPVQPPPRQVPASGPSAIGTALDDDIPF